MQQKHHRIDYLEFGVEQMERAKRFYAAAFGWRFQSYGPNYAGILAGESPDEGEVGGFDGAKAPNAAGPLVVLYSEDLAASLRAVEAAGGRIVEPIFDFPGGQRFEFLDSEGNRLGVWSSAPGE